GPHPAPDDPGRDRRSAPDRPPGRGRGAHEDRDRRAFARRPAAQRARPGPAAGHQPEHGGQGLRRADHRRLAGIAAGHGPVCRRPAPAAVRRRARTPARRRHRPLRERRDSARLPDRRGGSAGRARIPPAGSPKDRLIKARLSAIDTTPSTHMNIDHDCVIETRALSKRYGRKLALDSLDLRIPRGRIHAIVGANGAGKSTLFRILMGFMPPTSGEARILGKDSQALTPADRSRIGFVNEEHTLPNWMRVAQVTAMQKHQYPRWNQQAFDGVIGHYHVLPEQKVGQLSRGERAGFNLALALAQGPELLVLDEPTLGLDVVAKRAFLESLLYSNAADDCTVVYCSHQMEEIERVADNLIILERGQLKNMSAPEDFTSRVSHWVADVPFKGPALHTVPGLLE